MSNPYAGTSMFNRPLARFRPWHLLAAVTVLAILLAWYGNRQRFIQSEGRAIAGDWQMVDEQGKAVIGPSGVPLRITLNRDDFAIDPYAEPRRIDFISPTGTSMAIYEWDRGRLRVIQSQEGLARAASFSDEITDLQASSIGTYSLTSFLLERSNNP